MTILSQTTPNPSTKRFLPGQPLWHNQPIEIKKTDQSEDPLAKTIFAIQGINRLMLGYDWIAITKNDTKSWNAVEPKIIDHLTKYLNAKQPLTFKPTSSVHSNSIDQDIQTFLDIRIRPAIAQDGGDITLHQVKNNVAYITLKGACSGCPLSAQTKSGIETLLKKFFPQIQSLQDTTIHKI